MSGLHEENGQCVCDNPNKMPDEDGNCICQISQTNCPISDFTGENDCNCCPTETPKWNGLECRTCADVDATKPYYNSATNTCVECLTDAHCENEKVCSADKKCVCEMTQGDCSKTDFMGTDICACCPADLPVWDNSTKKCKACATLQPVYNTERHVCTCDESLGYAPDLEDGKCVCRDKIIVPQQAIFARPTGCNEKELISGPIGPYVCTYDIYVKGHIDDDFLIVDEKGNVLLPSYGNQHHMVDGILYRLQPGTKIYIYAQDNFCDIIAWERDWHVSEARTPIPGTLELRLVK
ncbi:MAG: hypothetical protein J6V11_05720, partial [Alphaproteobacteria bacterium]|nr:hypothetical protein [Alphaproteobacteria bacterium]